MREALTPPSGEPRVEVVILVGLPAAGKSTFYETRFRLTHCRVSKDLMRNVRRRDQRQQQLLSAALANRQSAVVDNTNVSAVERRELIAVARMHGARVVGYYFDVAVTECLMRNREPGRRRVPDVAIYAKARKLEPPAYSEGFDVLFRVCVSPTKTLDVRPWSPEVDDPPARSLDPATAQSLAPTHCPPSTC